ncbi:MAG TPA: hypothetical protein VK994_00785 [Bacteroidales bacterium]|nr:hypothetical protein [Bacteroidales bacterium]
MKTKTLTLVLIALMMGITMNTNASDDTTRVDGPAVNKGFCASIQLHQDNMVKFLVNNPNNDKIKLRILDENGFVLYTYIFKKDNAARIGFDISMLENGKYECVIERNKEEVVRKTIEKKNINK